MTDVREAGFKEAFTATMENISSRQHFRKILSGMLRLFVWKCFDFWVVKIHDHWLEDREERESLISDIKFVHEKCKHTQLVGSVFIGIIRPLLNYSLMIYIELQLASILTFIILLHGDGISSRAHSSIIIRIFNVMHTVVIPAEWGEESSILKPWKIFLYSFSFSPPASCF